MKKANKNRLYRTILLVVLAYEGAGSLLGGCLLMAAPDGRLMSMPLGILHGAFPDFLVPGILLFALSVLNITAFTAVYKKINYHRVVAGIALVGMLIWFWIEIAILQVLHWLHIMWGIPVVLGSLSLLLMTTIRPAVFRKTLLVCGILSSLLYAAINMIVTRQWKEYDPMNQTVSELSAIGAPTRTLWNILCFPYTLLMTAFSWGIINTAGENRRLHIAGILLLVYSLLGFLWLFAPMHPRSVLAAGGSTFSDTLHLALGAVTETLYLIVLALTAAALGKKFRIFSIACFLMLLVFGILTFSDASAVGVNQPTPFLGVWERINIGVFLLWVIALASVLMGQPGIPTAVYLKIKKAPAE